ncbi:hypothetical protein BK133_14520 [Paenibacillus sp. FSL H8-0548]|uniref:hypothetical protein n=1 Tax=Paenibacillus sp. FSL H8-0548 TaxID=1920422 RepID=UPI00096C6374|nr:hypothetical protein [Paenibacillus sp. FSL H8-0548]OMF32235.1 hypothetical protein BK133_14520 [Paenibacillus sp. FSL H8-0548]
MSFLYHYFDQSTGPFCNLSDLAPVDAERILEQIRLQSKGFASKRSLDYLEIRRSLELQAHELFIHKGGKPVRGLPHYMTLGSCPWLLDWYPNGRELQIALAEFDPNTISFTYGDLFPTMRYNDGKTYRGQIYTAGEIWDVIHKFGWPQEWNSNGDQGPERYIEVQIWDDRPLHKYRTDFLAESQHT